MFLPNRQHGRFFSGRERSVLLFGLMMDGTATAIDQRRRRRSSRSRRRRRRQRRRLSVSNKPSGVLEYVQTSTSAVIPWFNNVIESNALLPVSVVHPFFGLLCFVCFALVCFALVCFALVCFCLLFFGGSITDNQSVGRLVGWLIRQRLEERVLTITSTSTSTRPHPLRSAPQPCQRVCTRKRVSRRQLGMSRQTKVMGTNRTLSLKSSLWRNSWSK